MAASKSLSALLSRAALDDHEEILSAANDTLSKNKNDMQAQHARVVALLSLDRYDEALQGFSEAGDEFKEQALLEYAYALYKSGRLEEAQKAAATVNDRRSFKHVEAQAAYRLEKFSRTQELYRELTSPELVIEDEASDLRINQAANDAQLAWSGYAHSMTKAKPTREDLEQFDTAFNAACSYVAQGDLKQAEFLLRRAKDLCSAADELSEEDKKAELLPINIQHIFVLSRLGRQKEAEDLSANIPLSEITDKTIRRIATTNKLFLAHVDNPFKAHRLFHSGPTLDSKDRPFGFQSSILHENELALDLAAGKISRFTAHGTTADKTNVSDGVFIAAAHTRNQTGKAAIKELLPLLSKRPDDIGLLLTVVQLYLQNNNAAMATSVMESFMFKLEESADEKDRDRRFTPGLVALLVALYSQLNRISHCKAELAKASSYWRHKAKSSDHSLPILKAAGVALFDQSTTEELAQARDIFRHLEKVNPADPIIAAGLAASSDSIKTLGAEENLLLSIDKLTEGIDASALEQAGIAKTAPRQITTSGRKRAAADADGKTATKKKRSNKLPKDYDPNKKPDPERWLPLRDRSTWKPNRRKKGKAGPGGMTTQGGVVNEDSRPNTPSQQQQQQQRQTGQGQSKKKKGKGK